jgi:Stage III sporulation protein D.
MNAFIENRVLEEAAYIISTKCTIREAAKKFGYTKSTVHVDMKIRLNQIAPQYKPIIDKILSHNKGQRAVRGGEATKEKWRLLNERNN